MSAPVEVVVVPEPSVVVAKPDYLRHETTIRSWLLTTDHKRIGVMFLIANALALALGGFFALLIRTEHLTPTRTIMDAVTYNRVFTLHGVIMVWLFMIPSIPSGFGNFVLPIMLGAKDVAFPRLNLASFWIYVFGALWVFGGLLINGTDTGWTFYAPYSTRHSPAAVVPILFGIFIIGFSTIITGTNFIVTTHTMRAKGIGWKKMPLFVWAIYGTSVIQVLATPVLGMAVTLISLDHWFRWGLFDPASGGDPVLYEHLFWFYSHPAVYIMILPAMGVIIELICTYARKNPSSYEAIAYSTFGIAFVGFLSWGHHLFVAGMSTYDVGAFGILSMLVAIFSAIKVFTWVATLKRGSVTLSPEMVYVLSFLFLFVFGGMTGVAVATTSLDIHWHDTYFIVAHFHFIMVGGTLTAYLGAMHYWWPKITGRMYSRKWAFAAAILIFGAFVATFFPQFLLGNWGMPRRYFDYPAHYQPLHVVSTIGAYGLAGGMLMVVTYLAWSLVRGERAGRNPWRSASYEWRTMTPPPKHNFEHPPKFPVDCYDYTAGKVPDEA